jgi:hypothetical protein
MVDSVQGLLILVLTMPGFFGYLCFNRLSHSCIEDTFEKVGIVVGLNVGAVLIGALLGFALPDLLDQTQNLTLPGVVEFVARGLVLLTAISLALGALFAVIGNSRWISDLLRRSRLTRKTGAGSVVAAVLAKYPDGFLRVYLKNGGYVVGHPLCYSLDGKDNALFLERAAIGVKKAGSEWSQRPADLGVMLLSFDEVSFVELVKGIRNDRPA